MKRKTEKVISSSFFFVVLFCVFAKIFVYVGIVGAFFFTLKLVLADS